MIAQWLGHESVETTQISLQATFAMKEQALAKTSVAHRKRRRYRRAVELLGFLNGL